MTEITGRGDPNFGRDDSGLHVVKTEVGMNREMVGWCTCGWRETVDYEPKNPWFEIDAARRLVYQANLYHASSPEPVREPEVVKEPGHVISIELPEEGGFERDGQGQVVLRAVCTCGWTDAEPIVGSWVPGMREALGRLGKKVSEAHGT